MKVRVEGLTSENLTHVIERMRQAINRPVKPVTGCPDQVEIVGGVRADLGGLRREGFKVEDVETVSTR